MTITPKVIEGINKGTCQRRLQEGKPAFFVNYIEDGTNKYEFFTLVYQMYARYNALNNVTL
jgi:hypothetical protein